MFKKKVLVLGLAFMMCLSPSIVFAGESLNNLNSSIITPNWITVASTGCSLQINGGTAEAYAVVDVSDSNITTAKFTTNLQQYKSGKWTTIKTWKSTEAIEYLSAGFSGEYDIQKGYSYRLSGSISVYKGSTLVETVGFTSSTRSY